MVLRVALRHQRVSSICDINNVPSNALRITQTMQPDAVKKKII